MAPFSFHVHFVYNTARSLAAFLAFAAVSILPRRAYASLRGKEPRGLRHLLWEVRAALTGIVYVDAHFRMLVMVLSDSVLLTVLRFGGGELEALSMQTVEVDAFQFLTATDIHFAAIVSNLAIVLVLSLFGGLTLDTLVLALEMSATMGGCLYAALHNEGVRVALTLGLCLATTGIWPFVEIERAKESSLLSQGLQRHLARAYRAGVLLRLWVMLALLRTCCLVAWDAEELKGEEWSLPADVFYPSHVFFVLANVFWALRAFGLSTPLALWLREAASSTDHVKEA